MIFINFSRRSCGKHVDFSDFSHKEFVKHGDFSDFSHKSLAKHGDFRDFSHRSLENSENILIFMVSRTNLLESSMALAFSDTNR